MSIETLLEAAKFLEWSTQLQHNARENEKRQQVHTEKNKATGLPPTPVVTHPHQSALHPPPPTASHPPQQTLSTRVHVATKPVTSSLPQDVPWKTSSHTTPRPLETSVVSNRPLAHQTMGVHPTPTRAVTPPTPATNFLQGLQYRPLAPVPSQSPNSKSPPFIAYRRVDSFDSNSNQSTESGKSDDKKSDTREVHNKLEKNRRAHLKDCFDNLKAQVPNMEDKKIKTSNLSILQGALRYLQALKRKERDLEHQLDKLARQKITYQQRLAKLKMEKGVTDDQLPWNHHEESEEEIEEEERGGGDDDDQASTSTASEAEEEERKSRAQSPVQPSQPQPQPIQPLLQAFQPRNRTPEVFGPKVMHSVTKEIHSGPYVISRHIITHRAQAPSPTKPQRAETLPIISQLARKQAGKPIIGAFEERHSVMSKTVYPGSVIPTQVLPTNTTHSISQSGTSIPVAMQHMGVNSQSGSRQTVSQLLGKQAPGVRAPARRPTPGSHTSVIHAPLRQPGVPAVYPPVPVSLIGVTTQPTTATAVTVASKNVITTALTSSAVSHPVVTSSVMYPSVTTKSLIQPAMVPKTVGPTTGSTLRPISPALHGAQIQSSANSATIASVAPPTALTPRTVAPSFLSPLAMQPSALTQVLFTQPPVAAYSLAQSPLIQSALPQTVLRPPVAVTTVTQSVITQIITTQPMTTVASGKVAPISTQTITTPAIAPMVSPTVAPYQSLAALSPYPVTLGPPLALNKALVTTTPAYTTLPLGTAALQKLTMSPLPFQNPTIPITAGTTQAAILSPITGLATPGAKLPSAPITTPIPLTTPLLNTTALRPRVSVNPATVAPGVAMATGAPVVTTNQPAKNPGVRFATPKTSSGVKITVPKKDKPQQGVTTSQMAQILAASKKNVVTSTKTAIPAGTQPSPSNVSKAVTVNQ